MGVHDLIVVSVGTYGVLLLMGGAMAVLRPRRLLERWFALNSIWVMRPTV